MVDSKYGISGQDSHVQGEEDVEEVASDTDMDRNHDLTLQF